MKWKCYVEYHAKVHCEIEAESEDEAKRKALEYADECFEVETYDLTAKQIKDDE